MARFDERSGQLYVTELGRVASHFYIRHKSIVAFNELLKPHMTESEVHAALCPITAYAHAAVLATFCPSVSWCRNAKMCEATRPLMCSSSISCTVTSLICTGRVATAMAPPAHLMKWS